MAGINKDAEIRIGITGADDAAAALGKLKSALGGIGGAVGNSVASVASDLVRAMTALGAIDFAGAANRYRAYNEEVGRFSVVTGDRIDALKNRFVGLSDRTGVADERVAQFTHGLQRATYDASNSAKAVGALGDEALGTGRSLEDMGALGTTLHNSLGRTFDEVPEELGRIRAVADSLGTVGGPAALEDQLVSLAGTLVHVSAKGKADVDQLVATIGAIGKGLRPQQAQQVQQRLLGFVTTQTEPLRYQLGIKFKDFYDEEGNVRDVPGALLKLKQNAIRRWGKRAQAILAQDQNLGPQGASALMRLNEGEIRQLAAQPPSDEAARKASAFFGTDAGKSITTRNRLDRDKREEAGGPIAKAQQAIGETFEGHPFAAFFAGTVGANLAGKTLGWLFGSGGGGGAAAGLEGAAGAASKGSRAWQALGGLLRLVGGGSATIGTAAVAGGMAMTYGGLKLVGADQLNAARPQIESETASQLELQREGRARALGRAYTRSGGDVEGFKEEAGSRLLAEMVRDRDLDMVGRGLFEQRVPDELRESSPDLAGVLQEMVGELKALRTQPPVVQIQDDSGHPNKIIVLRKGAAQ